MDSEHLKNTKGMSEIQGSNFFVGLDGSGPYTGLSGATGIYLPFSTLEEALNKIEIIKKPKEDQL
jgi:hypothetical protein